MVNKLFYIPIILSWSLPTFIYKDLTKYFNNYQLIVLYHLIYHVFIFGSVFFLIFYNKDIAIEFFKNTRKLPLKLKLLMTAIVVLGLISQYSYFQLLRGIGVNELLSIVRGASTLMVLLVGYFIYKENLTILKILGIFLVLAGVLLINNF